MKFKFIHTPKCGGSTLRHSILANKSDEITFSGMDHETKYEEGCEHITIIRHPPSRTISHFNEMLNNTTDELKFSDWFDKKYHNFQTKFLMKQIFGVETINKSNFDKLLKVLDSFYMVLVTERLDKDIDKLFKKLGFKDRVPSTNIAQKRYKPTIEDFELIMAKCNWDFKLWLHFQ